MDQINLDQIHETQMKRRVQGRMRESVTRVKRASIEKDTTGGSRNSNGLSRIQTGAEEQGGWATTSSGFNHIASTATVSAPSIQQKYGGREQRGVEGWDQMKSSGSANKDRDTKETPVGQVVRGTISKKQGRTLRRRKGRGGGGEEKRRDGFEPP